MFYNTVTKKLYNGEKGIEVIPVFYKMTYPEWAPFDKSEGRPIHPDRGPEVMAQTTKQGTKDVLANGNEIIKTANHFVIILGIHFVIIILIIIQKNNLNYCIFNINNI